MRVAFDGTLESAGNVLSLGGCAEVTVCVPRTGCDRRFLRRLRDCDGHSMRMRSQSLRGAAAHGAPLEAFFAWLSRQSDADWESILRELRVCASLDCRRRCRACLTACAAAERHGVYELFEYLDEE